MTTKVILLQDVADLGGRGEIVDVADGYARNYLVPQKKAMAATRGAVAQAESMREAQLENLRRVKADAEQLAQSPVGTRVVVAARAGDEGRLFGSIGEADVTETIRKFTGVEIDRKIVTVGNPIKEIGLHEVTLRPHPEVEFQVTLDVIPA
jgi:large subunit ribosomal protein L9